MRPTLGWKAVPVVGSPAFEQHAGPLLVELVEHVVLLDAQRLSLTFSAWLGEENAQAAGLDAVRLTVVPDAEDSSWLADLVLTDAGGTPLLQHDDGLVRVWADEALEAIGTGDYLGQGTRWVETVNRRLGSSLVTAAPRPWSQRQGWRMPSGETLPGRAPPPEPMSVASPWRDARHEALEWCRHALVWNAWFRRVTERSNATPLVLPAMDRWWRQQVDDALRGAPTSWDDRWVFLGRLIGAAEAADLQAQALAQATDEGQGSGRSSPGAVRL